MINYCGLLPGLYGLLLIFPLTTCSRLFATSSSLVLPTLSLIREVQNDYHSKSEESHMHGFTSMLDMDSCTPDYIRQFTITAKQFQLSLTKGDAAIACKIQQCRISTFMSSLEQAQITLQEIIHRISKILLSESRSTTISNH